MQDNEVLVLLHDFRQPTFFTRDDDFYNGKLCHSGYCLVHLAVRKDEAAVFIRRFLRHPKFNTQAKRMGSVVRVSHGALSVWRKDAEEQVRVEWGS